MTDASWDQYLTGDDGGSVADPLAAATDDAGDAVVADQAESYLSTAASDSDWSDWNAATGDDAVSSAQSYFDAASEAAAGGYNDLAADEIADGNQQLGVAADSYGDAASYDETASSYLQGAGGDLSTLASDTDSDDLAAAATNVSGASDDYSAAAADYSDASSDATSYVDDSSDNLAS